MSDPLKSDPPGLLRVLHMSLGMIFLEHWQHSEESNLSFYNPQPFRERWGLISPSLSRLEGDFKALSVSGRSLCRELGRSFLGPRDSSCKDPGRELSTHPPHTSQRLSFHRSHL